MPLGSEPTSKIVIDFTRAQGTASSGRIWFQPPRQKVGGTMLDGVPVPVDLVNGVATIDLVRLPTGTYRVIEQFPGRSDRAYDFSLPVTAPDVVYYKDIVQVSPIPSKHMFVSKINGLSPDPITGNIVLDVGGVQPDHPHTVSQISDFVTAVNAAIANVVDAAPASLDTLNELAQAIGDNPNLASDLIAMIAGKAALVHSHPMSEIVGLVSALAAKQTVIFTRSAYITTGSYNPLPNTGGNWVSLNVEQSIPAAVGDRIRVGCRGIRNSSSGVYLDLATVTGSGPTVIKRFLTTGTSSPLAEGDPAWYHSSSFINQSAPRQLTVQSGDLDAGNVRVAVACKGNGTGILFAESAYPFYMLLENIGPEPS